MRDTGGGFGQKIMVQRDEMCLMLAARKVGAPVKWVEDRRENLLAAGKSRHEHADVRMAFDADGAIQARQHRLRVRLRRVPHAVAGRYRGASSGMLFPGPYRVPHGGVHDQDGLHEHRRPHRVPRAVAVRDARARGAARHRGPARWASIRSSCAAATCCAATSCPYTNPNGMTYDRHLAARDVRAGARACSTTTRSAPSRPTRAQRGPLPRRRHRRTTSSRRRPGYRVLRHRRRDDPHRAVGHGQRVHRRRLDREQHRDDRRAAHRRRARRRHRRRRTRSRATPRSPASAPARAGSRSGSMTAGAVRETATILRERHRRHRRAQARSRGRRHRARRQPRERARAPRRSASRSPRSPTLAYFEPPSLPPGVPGRARGERAVHAPTSDRSG